MRRDPGTAVHGGDGPGAGQRGRVSIARPNPIVTVWVAHYRIGLSRASSARWTPTCGGRPGNGPDSSHPNKPRR